MSHSAINSKTFFNATWTTLDHKNQVQSFCWQIPDDLPYFEGHFPQNPILPAIAIIDYSTLALEKILDKKIYIRKLKKAKFMNIIRPQDKMSIELSRISPKDYYLWRVVWKREEEMISELFVDISPT